MTNKRANQARYAQKLISNGQCVKCRQPKGETKRLCRNCMNYMNTYIGKYRVELGLVDPFKSKYA